MMIRNRAGSGDETTRGGKRTETEWTGGRTTAELVGVREEGQRKKYEGHW